MGKNAQWQTKTKLDTR